MTRFFNLIASDVGRSIGDIRSKAGYDDLHVDARAVLDTLQARGAELRAEDGKWFSMRILPYRTKENTIDGVVATFVDITDRKLAEKKMLEAKLFAENIVDTMSESLLTLDSELNVLSANASFYRSFDTTREATENRRLRELDDGRWNIPLLEERLAEIVRKKTSAEDFEIEWDFPSIGPKRLLFKARPLAQSGHSPGLILLVIRDITRQDQREKELRRNIEELQEQVEQTKRADSSRRFC